MSRSDINLLPKKKKVPFKVVFLVFFVTLLILLTGAAGFVVPDYLLGQKKVELEKLRNELDEYKDVQTEYFQKMKDFTELSNIKNDIESFKSADIQTLELMEKILDARPDTLDLISQEYETDQIVIEGRSSDIYAISRYEVALRKLGIFGNIHLETVHESPFSTTFFMTLYHPSQAQGGESNE